MGSRPAKRNAAGGIESLRAIPWTFAWSQIRLHLPAWFGVAEALDCKVRPIALAYSFILLGSLLLKSSPRARIGLFLIITMAA